jgi:hypothetical protein
MSLLAVAADPSPMPPGEIFLGVGAALDPAPPQSQGQTAASGDDAPGTATRSVAPMTATPWGPPVPVSPDSGVLLRHFPRETTVAWMPVTGATAYRVETAYYDTIWNSLPAARVEGEDNASHTFGFIADNRGRWRVKAFNGSVWSAASPWWYFSYRTKAQMPKATLISPSADEVLHHWPRTTTLAWKMVPGASGYLVERMMCLGPDQCSPYDPVEIDDPLRSFYTFDFVGMQPGKWRVTVLGGPDYEDSLPCDWRWFYYEI